MVAIQHVEKWYGRVHALRGVTFELQPGQVAGLLGPNGAGKSTTIKVLTGLIPPDRGRAAIRGHDTLDDSLRARAALGYLPESAPVYPEMTVLEYLTFRARLFGVPRNDRRRAVSRALERCWLTDVQRRPLGHLSKGYRQRAGLAAAILHDPPVLVLDEPTNGLDPTQITQMRALVRELGSDRTMLVSSHILPEINAICSRILILAGGVLRADGSPDDLIARHGAPARVAIEARAPAERLETVIRAVPGVQSVRTEPCPGADTEGWTKAEATPHAREADLREPIAAAFASAGILVRELTVRRSSIEDVFLSLTQADGPAAVGFSTPAPATTAA